MGSRVKPMPGLKNEALGVVPGVGQGEAEPNGVLLQPPVCVRLLKLLGKVALARGADVDRPACVVLAVAGSRDGFQDLPDLQALGELLPDDFLLARPASEAGDGDQHNAFGPRRVPHRAPCPRGLGYEADAPSRRGAFDLDKIPGLLLRPDPAALCVVRRYRKSAHPPCSASQRSASMAAWHPMPAAVMA